MQPRQVGDDHSTPPGPTPATRPGSDLSSGHDTMMPSNRRLYRNPTVRVPIMSSALVTTRLIIVTRSCSGLHLRAGRIADGDWVMIPGRRAVETGPPCVTNALAVLRLRPMSDRAKDAEILALRH
jgi:hypothetical protein